jgi:hypothetical protein
MSPLETIEIVRSAGGGLELGEEAGETFASGAPVAASFEGAKLQEAISTLVVIRKLIRFEICINTRLN